MDSIDLLWIVICAIIILDMQAGFLCLESGIARAKNATNVALKNLTDVCLVSMAFWAVGFGLMHGPGGNGVFAWGAIFPDVHAFEDGMNALFLFQIAFAATAATIVSGAVAERERYAGYVCLSLLLGAFVYPIAGHWVWGGALPGSSDGWLYSMGFIDFAGATVVHAVGGFSALAAVIVLGPRLGRFGPKARRFEESSLSMAALGTILLWIGWGAFNGGSAMLFNQSVPTIIINTMVTAASGGLFCIVTSVVLLRHVRIDFALNGVLAGLVAGTAGVHLYGIHASIAVGALGGIAMMLCTEALERLRIDDVVGAVPVHLAAGLCGTLALPFLAPVDALAADSRGQQFLIQVLGVVAVGAWVTAAMLPAALILNRLGLLRARGRNEVIGLNMAENRKRNAFHDLITDMRRHTTMTNLNDRARVERSSEAGALAIMYNNVLDRMQDEIREKMASMQREKEMRTAAERSFEAMEAAQRQSAWVARHDKLTGLGNRLLLEEIADSDAYRKNLTGVLAVAIDLDRFKDVNDTYGHEAGDAVLMACASRLQEHIKPDQDFGFRIGGDEFVLLLSVKDTPAQDDALCEALLRSLIAPVRYDAVDLRVGASIGYSRGMARENISEVLKRADLALYEAKNGGRNQAVPYDDTMGTVHREKMAMIEDFKAAMDRGEFEIRFQPQVDALTHSLSGAEVLVRWVHPTRGVLTPDIFIPIAEELKMLGDLDRIVLDLALAARSRMQDALGHAPDISVNVSARRLFDPNLLPELRARQDLPAKGLSFEVLETAFLDNQSEDLADKIFELKALGIGIEVDDFGTGHASVSSVLALRPDRLKIDRVFVQDVDTDPERLNMMRGIIDMARNVRAETIVEGVETLAQAQALREAGADFLQGYAFARPLPLEDFIAWCLEAGKQRSA